MRIPGIFLWDRWDSPLVLNDLTRPGKRMSVWKVDMKMRGLTCNWRKDKITWLLMLMISPLKHPFMDWKLMAFWMPKTMSKYSLYGSPAPGDLPWLTGCGCWDLYQLTSSIVNIPNQIFITCISPLFIIYVNIINKLPHIWQMLSWLLCVCKSLKIENPTIKYLFIPIYPYGGPWNSSECLTAQVCWVARYVCYTHYKCGVAYFPCDTTPISASRMFYSFCLQKEFGNWAYLFCQKLPRRTTEKHGWSALFVDTL